MSLSTYALITPDEIKEALSLQGTGMDVPLENLANGVSDTVETALRRKIVSRGSLTEYHTLERDVSQITLTQRPILSITTVKEGGWWSGAWTAQLVLTANVDYLSDKPAGKLMRMSGNTPTSWMLGIDSVQVVYTAGLAATTALVPAAIKRVALKLACREFQEMRRGGEGAQQMNDGMGFVTRFMPSELLRLEETALGPFLVETFGSTGRVV